jgi:hypothetical protein
MLSVISKLKTLTILIISIDEVTKGALQKFQRLKIPHRFLRQSSFTATGRVQNMLFYRDLISLYPSYCYQVEYFSGDFEMLPFFMQLPVKHKILMNYQSTLRTQLSLLESTLEDTVTDRLEFYMSRYIRNNEKMIEWMLKTCVNLTKLFCINFPEQGVLFTN